MQIQTSNAVSVIAIELETKVNDIVKDVGELPEKLAGDLVSQGIMPTGPMQFLYAGMSEDPEASFQLRIALPVSKANAERYEGPHKVSRLEPFQFVESVLYGDIAELENKAYDPLIGEIHKAGLTMTGAGREVYQNFDGPDSADNETRVQIVIKP